MISLIFGTICTLKEMLRLVFLEVEVSINFAASG